MSERETQKVVVTKSTKSVGIALLLTLIFGPLGMFYSTISGAIIMCILTLFAGIFTAGFGFLLTWPICVIWAAVAASNYNKRLMASAQG